MLEVGTWEDVEHIVHSQPVGIVMRVPKRWLSHPTDHGLARVFGFPEGQVADYHKPLDDGGRLFVREFQQWYEIHREEEFPWLALTPTPPSAPDQGEEISGAAALGSLVGSMIGESPRAVLAGAAVGGLLAAALIASGSRRSRAG